ncbi:MAG: hypothetical protein HYR93_10980 [Chloroflexi bacterium]|nr:hypothetical protein [Chloroflexota bacterium]
MSIRPLDLLDLPSLYRYRGEAVSLDAARLLTRGNPLGAVGMLAYMNPRRHVYTAVSDGDGATLLGGITHTAGDTFAKLLYLAPALHLDHSSAPALIEHLSAQTGPWGAFHVLAEVDEDSDAFPALRIAGFSVYAWQRMWDISNITAPASKSSWMRVQSINLPSIQNLYHQIVPPLLQPVEPTPTRVTGYMCSDGVKCYVTASVGMMGIVLNPLIHPEATEVGVKLTSLVGHLPSRRNRPVYFCVRSYQAWLEPVLEDLGAKAAVRQAVMVKHLVRMVKDEQAIRAAQPAGVTIQPSRVSRMHAKK